MSRHFNPNAAHDQSPSFVPRGFFLQSGPPEFDFDVVNRATQLALIAHAGQTRKDGVTPQIAHPLAVQGLLAQAGVLDATLHAVALLHDSVEDSPANGADVLKQIEYQLGAQTAQMVRALTDDPQIEKSQRKSAQLVRLQSASHAVRLVKLADCTASLYEGPAPYWDDAKKCSYTAQRRRLFDECLRGTNANLEFYFKQALARPVWNCAT